MLLLFVENQQKIELGNNCDKYLLSLQYHVSAAHSHLNELPYSVKPKAKAGDGARNSNALLRGANPPASNRKSGASAPTVYHISPHLHKRGG